MPRILAVDPGTRRVGLAITDPLGILAQPWDTLDGRNLRRLVEEIHRIVREMDIRLVLVGFPVGADGYEGEGCRRARKLQERLVAAGLEAILWDESGSTEDALVVTRQHGMDRRKSRAARDSVAASFILASYLSSGHG